MDFYKMKFKAAFRWRKVKSFFKLCEYNFRKKFNLEGDDQFYYHLQRQLLRDGMDIKSAAEACGFADRYHFSKEFKKHHNSPPGKWQKTYRKQ